MIELKETYAKAYPKLTNWNKIPEEFINHQTELQDNWQTYEVPDIDEYEFNEAIYLETPLLKEESLSDPLSVDTSQYLSKESKNSGQIEYLGHQLKKAELNSDAQSQGIVVCDLFQAMADYPEIVEKAMYSALSYDQDTLSAYQSAYLNGGVFVYVPSGVELKAPLEMLLLQDARYQGVSNKHLLIVVGDNVYCDFYISVRSTGSKKSLLNLTAEVIMGNNSNVNYVQMDALDKNVSAFNRCYGRLQRDSHIHWSIASMDDGDTVVDTQTYLEGRGSTTASANIAITTEKQRQLINTHAINLGNETDVNILQHGVAMDYSHLTFNAIGDIRKYAKNSNSEQSSRVLMMSPNSKANANPILLIDEFEVTAGHAVTVGRVDEEQIWYLMSRGIDSKVAEYLIIRGFLSSVIENMPSEQIQKDMLAIIEYKMRNFLN